MTRAFWPHPNLFLVFTCTPFVLILFVSNSFAQTHEALLPPASTLKKLSVAELMNIEVTSVSRRPEKLAETASAIQVITQEDIHRSGATRLPEALRLASNLEVDQIDSSQWAISARGFNSPLANKLLVMIDGRTVYTPLFAGVFWYTRRVTLHLFSSGSQAETRKTSRCVEERFIEEMMHNHPLHVWDVQDTLLADIDRVEVISGPGATLWGANAVNGVINITTKSAKDTQGVLLEGGGGTELRDFGDVRYGGALASNLYIRVYGKYFDRDSTVFSTGRDADNDWRMGQGGFRLDWDASAANHLTLQGDLYDSRTEVAGAKDTVTRGGNVLGRWSHTVSEESDFKLQLYFDRSHRDIPGSYNDKLNTYDVDFQHRFSLGTWHDVVWGAGYRLVEDNFGPGALILVPQRISLQTFSAFVQDEIALITNRLHLTLGTKIEHNDYTGFEFQPSARLAWKLSPRQTLWAAISRAVRTPSRIDRDLIIPPVSIGGPDFDSEEVLAYELGYRIQPHQRLSLALAAYYNDYDNIRTLEQANPPAPFPLLFANGQRGESYGAEVTADYRVTEWWRLRAGYSELRLHIRSKPGSTDTTSGAAEAADSDHHFSLRSAVDLPWQCEFDAAFRYVSHITNPTQDVPGYSELDVRLAWHPTPNLEFSLVGQNLLHACHVEFGDPATRQEIERGMYGKVAWHF